MKDSTRQALMIAAERSGRNTYDQQAKAYLKAHPGAKRVLGNMPKGFRFCVTDVHNAIVKALNEDWGDESAMALLHSYDCDKARFGKVA